MRDKNVEDAMTPLESVYMLNINSIIDKETMQDASVTICSHRNLPVIAVDMHVIAVEMHVIVVDMHVIIVEIR